VQNGTVGSIAVSDYFRVNKEQQCVSVPCPICGGYAGPGCNLHAGDLRPEPHVDRKLAAAEAIEAKRITPARVDSV
jgi:hypothetical protein